MVLQSKHLLGIEELGAQDINTILNTAESLREINTRRIKKVPTLRGISAINVFFEPSTRTRVSFEMAQKRLSADSINISESTSSATKGETLIDTGKNIQAMNPDIVVIRHPHSGAPHLLAQNIRASVINAGDGTHEHPTQALLDMLTIRDAKGGLADLTVTIVGDIDHSRVARSNIFGLTRMGARVRVCGPATMLPVAIERLGATPFTNLNQALEGADVIMMLRIQKERLGHAPLFPSTREYSRQYGLNPARLKFAKPDAIVMHPGPVNWGVELSAEFQTHPQSVILGQVENGVAVRMAVMYLLAGGSELRNST